MSEEGRLGFLERYALLEQDGKPVLPALDEEQKKIIVTAMANGRYWFKLHAAVPCSEKNGAISLAGHMWITIESEDGTAWCGLGFYPQRKTLSNAICGRGVLRAEAHRPHYDYAVISVRIAPADIIRIAELARGKFLGQRYCIGGLFGAFDCTGFAEEAARIVRLDVPRRTGKLWTRLPFKRIEAIYWANRGRDGVHCRLDRSAWENQRRTIKSQALQLIERLLPSNSRMMIRFQPECRD